MTANELWQFLSLHEQGENNFQVTYENFTAVGATPEKAISNLILKMWLIIDGFENGHV